MSFFQRFDVRIFLVVFGLSSVWILGSDYLVYSILPRSLNLKYVNTGKGLFFVFVISAVIALMYRREKALILARLQDFQRFFHYSPTAMIIFDRATMKILEMNKSARALYGEAIGKGVLEIGFERNLFAQLSNKDFAQEGLVDLGEDTMRVSSGDKVPVRLSLTQVRLREQSCYLLRIINLTELKEAQEMMSLNTKLITLGEIASGMAHEIKNPLSIISLIISKLQDKFSSDAHALKDLKMIDDSIIRITSTITSLQRMSRHDFRDMAARFSLYGVIQDALVLTKEAIVFRQCQVNVSVDEDLEIMGKEAELCQVFINLVKNAIDAMDKSTENWLTISAREREGEIEVRVMNSGEVIPEHVRKNIFKKFYTTKPKGKGTGIGLSISQKIVQRHGGELSLDLDSIHTTFVIRLPKQNPSDQLETKH